jgi:hypothetical protein
MSREQLTVFLHAAITSLPQHLQAALRLMDDPDIPDEGRLLAAGSVMHFLSGSNSIPGVRGGALSYVDDVLILRISYERIEQLAPEAMQKHRESTPDVFGGLVEELALVREELGKSFAVLERAVDRLGQLKHRGIGPKQCVSDEEHATMLFDEVTAALVDVDIEEGSVTRSLKQLGPVLEGLKRHTI